MGYIAEPTLGGWVWLHKIIRGVQDEKMFEDGGVFSLQLAQYGELVNTKLLVVR